MNPIISKSGHCDKCFSYVCFYPPFKDVEYTCKYCVRDMIISTVTLEDKIKCMKGSFYDDGFISFERHMELFHKEIWSVYNLK